MKKVIIIIIHIFLICSCNPAFLDENPQSFTTKQQKYETEEDFELALTGVYEVLGLRSAPMIGVDTRFANYAYGLLAFGECGTDEVFTINQVRIDEVNLDTYAIYSSASAINALFATMYLGVSRANEIISRLEGDKELSDTMMAIYGEALFLRALYYFNLVRTFGGVPLPLTPLSIDTWLSNHKREPVQDVFMCIISDLQKASFYLTAEKRNSEAGRATSVAADALLAKVYLHAASMKKVANMDEAVRLDGLNSYEWVDAEKYYTLCAGLCEKIFKTCDNPLDPLAGIAYNSGFWPNENGPESIFEVQFSTSFSVNTGGLIGKAFGQIGNNDNGNKWLQPTGEEYFTYSEFDDRYKHNVLKRRVVSGAEVEETLTKFWSFMKYNNGFKESETNSNNSKQPQNFIVIRMADMCLTYAEALGELYDYTGSNEYLGKALNMLNNVRRRARGDSDDILVDIPAEFITNDININGTQEDRNQVYAYLRPIAGIVSMPISGDNVISINITPGELDSPVKRFRALILNERKWELIGEGHRWYDLVRLGVLEKILTAMNERYMMGNADNLVQKRDISHFHILRPIPMREVDMGLVQNYGY